MQSQTCMFHISFLSPQLWLGVISVHVCSSPGAPTAHIKYGVPPALLGAYSALFHILLSVEVHLNNTWVALEECARMHHCNSMEVCLFDLRGCKGNSANFPSVPLI